MIQDALEIARAQIFLIQTLFLKLPIISKFVIVFGLIVVLPKLAERMKLPGVIGLMGGGILLGPHLLGFLDPKGSVIDLFSELGKLLLMFFAGIEINLPAFQKVGKQSAGFGFLTFVVPLLIGTGVGLAMNFNVNTSILLGSLMSSHTLLGLPVMKQLGLSQNRGSLITLGATIFTDIASMLVLAICLSVHTVGFSWSHLSLSLLELACYVPLVIFGLSWTAKQLFGKVEGQELQFGILILMIVVASILAGIIELEGIVGAFLTGIAVNKAGGEKNEIIRALSVVSHGLFIPAFFLATGFLVDLKTFANTIFQQYTAVVLVVGGLLLAKYLAARLAGKCYHLEKNEALFMWSLSIPQVAATLAAAIVAYQAVNQQGQRLLSESMLNVVIVLIIVTSIAGPILSKRYGNRLVIKAEGGVVEADKP